MDKPEQDDPLLELIGMAGKDVDSPRDLAARHDEYLAQAQEEDDAKRMAQQRRLIAEWEVHSRDTAPEIDQRRLAAAWSAPTWRKLRMAAEMSQAARDLTLAGLRHRHPDANEREIRFRFASLLYGSEIASRLFSGSEEQGSNAV